MKPVPQVPPRLPEKPDAEPTVYTLLAGQARRASTVTLAVAIALGAVDAATVAVAHPSAAWLGLPAIAVLSFGAWGLADRALYNNQWAPSWLGRRTLLLRSVRAAAPVIGTLAAVGTVLGLFSAMFGGWIS
ncbi:MAG: hypothetical protein M3373_11040 [Gemmatimonadota bacterium]|nr:hypothetical protein [Gemmatimonadota bacterium]